MELGSLWTLLHKSPNLLNSTQKTNIAIGIAHGMKYLHHHGIIHRDLKSPNILLDHKLLPKISDFGLSKILKSYESNNGEEIMTNCTGTANWMAPEQISSNSYSFQVDVYAYGLILYELLTGECPFNKLNQVQIYDAVRSGIRPEIPIQYRNSSIVNLIVKCWQQNPFDRPTFDEIYIELITRKVEFPGTNNDGVKLLLHYIDNKTQVNHESKPFNSSKLLNNTLNIYNTINNNNDIFLMKNKLFEYAKNGNIDDFVSVFVSFLNVKDLINYRDNSSYIYLCFLEFFHLFQTALHYACCYGQAQMVQFLLGIQGININIKDINGNTPLSVAVQCEQKFIVSLLINSNGIDVNLSNESLLTPLHYAVITNNSDIAKLLLFCKDIDLNVVDGNGNTPLDIAIKLGFNTLAEMINQKSINML